MDMEWLKKEKWEQQKCEALEVKGMERIYKQYGQRQVGENSLEL
jgi:hypothetical protein